MLLSAAAATATGTAAAAAASTDAAAALLAFCTRLREINARLPHADALAAFLDAHQNIASTSSSSSFSSLPTTGATTPAETASHARAFAALLGVWKALSDSVQIDFAHRKAQTAATNAASSSTIYLPAAAVFDLHWYALCQLAVAARLAGNIPTAVQVRSHPWVARVLIL
jgi:hypothetical protein